MAKRTHHKKTRRVANPVARNLSLNRAQTEVDRKKAAKRGAVKHRAQLLAGAV